MSTFINARFGLFQAAATVSVSLLTWAVLNDSREGADTDPLVQAALEGERQTREERWVCGCRCACKVRCYVIGALADSQRH